MVVKHVPSIVSPVILASFMFMVRASIGVNPGESCGEHVVMAASLTDTGFPVAAASLLVSVRAQHRIS